MTSPDPPTPKQADAAVSIGKAAAYLGVSVTTIRRWTDEGVLAVERTHGGHRRYRKSALDARRAAQSAGTDAGHLDAHLVIQLAACFVVGAAGHYLYSVSPATWWAVLTALALLAIALPIRKRIQHRRQERAISAQVAAMRESWRRTGHSHAAAILADTTRTISHHTVATSGGTHTGDQPTASTGE